MSGFVSVRGRIMALRFRDIRDGRAAAATS